MVDLLFLKVFLLFFLSALLVVMSGNCGAWELKTVSYVDG